MKFRKKPVIIEAINYNGTNIEEIRDVFGATNITGGKGTLFIPTLEGIMEASVGDWIIQGVNGELYPCKPNIFAKTYEPA